MERGGRLAESRTKQVGGCFGDFTTYSRWTSLFLIILWGMSPRIHSWSRIIILDKKPTIRGMNIPCQIDQEQLFYSHESNTLFPCFRVDQQRCLVESQLRFLKMYHQPQLMTKVSSNHRTICHSTHTYILLYRYLPSSFCPCWIFQLMWKSGNSSCHWKSFVRRQSRAGSKYPELDGCTNFYMSIW